MNTFWHRTEASLSKSWLQDWVGKMGMKYIHVFNVAKIFLFRQRLFSWAMWPMGLLLYWVWRWVIPIHDFDWDARRVWQSADAAYSSYAPDPTFVFFQGSVLPCTRFCLCFLGFDYLLHIANFAILYKWRNIIYNLKCNRNPKSYIYKV
jgi:hypothetical protein